jgi:hypothetical protein
VLSTSREFERADAHAPFAARTIQCFRKVPDLALLPHPRAGKRLPQTFIAIADALDQVAAGAVDWPLMVKPRRGSASMNLTCCYDRIQLEGAFEACPQPMIQEVLKGTEYGFDLFADTCHRPVSVYCKRKLAMRAGETDKAVSTNNPVLIEFGVNLLDGSISTPPPAARTVVDVIVDKDGPKLLNQPAFGEANLSHWAGRRSAKNLAMRKGQPLTPDIGACRTICMLKRRNPPPDLNGSRADKRRPDRSVAPFLSGIPHHAQAIVDAVPLNCRRNGDHMNCRVHN